MQEQHAISPTINIFVLGDSGSGKSTIVKALSTERNFFGKYVKVKTDELPTTSAGIVPTMLHSPKLGSVNFYDCAGHEEYYASHEMILQQTSQAKVVLLIINLLLSREERERQLSYWCSLLSNHCTTELHLFVIGSHCDKVNDDDTQDMKEMVTSMMMGLSTMLTSHEFIPCNCRSTSSHNLKHLRDCLENICYRIFCSITPNKTDHSSRLCASLMHHFINKSQAGIVTTRVGDLWKELKRMRTSDSTLVQLKDLNVLIETCQNLNTSGHLIFLIHDVDNKKSTLILNEKVVLSKIHACLAAVKQKIISNDFGMLEETQLKKIITSSLGGVIGNTDIAIQYLLFTQFCTQVTPKRLVSVPEKMKTEKHFFFPNLVLASRPELSLDAKSKGGSRQTEWCTWCLKATNPCQFFTPRFLHMLFIQLVKFEGEAWNAQFTIWRNGILFVCGSGTVMCVVEVMDETSQLQLATQCVRGEESRLVMQRSKLISRINNLIRKTCPRIELKAFFLPPHSSYPASTAEEIPIASVAKSVVSGKADILYTIAENEEEGAHRVTVRRLLYFDAFHEIEDKTLSFIFSMKDSDEPVAEHIQKALKSCCKELVEKLASMAGQGSLSYNQLYGELAKYSIFTDKNLHELAGLPVHQCKDSDEADTEQHY